MTTNISPETRVTEMPADILQILAQRPTASNMAKVDVWLTSHAQDTEFWRALPGGVRSRLHAWVADNNVVQFGQLLSGALCVALVLCFTARPLTDLHGDGAGALVLTLGGTWLGCMMAFPLLCPPLSRSWNGMLGLKAATSLLDKLTKVYDSELGLVYEQVNHHPMACQYLYDVRQLRAVCRHDVNVAQALAAQANPLATKADAQSTG